MPVVAKMYTDKGKLHVSSWLILRSMQQRVLLPGWHSITATLRLQPNQSRKHSVASVLVGEKQSQKQKGEVSCDMESFHWPQ